MPHETRHVHTRPASCFVAAALLLQPLSIQHPSVHAQSPTPAVIESVAPVWTSASAWRIDTAPMLTLGDGDVLFASVAGAHRYADGRVTVADNKATELLMFDARGTLIRKIARRGNGPGELQAFEALMHAGGDTLVVWDYRNRRLSMFDANGNFLRSPAVSPIQLEGGGTITPVPIGVFPGASWLARQRVYAEAPRVTRITRDSATLTVVNNASRTRLGTFFIGEGWDFYHSDGVNSFGNPPFSRTGAIATGPRSVFYSDGQRYEVIEYDVVTSTSRVFRIRRTPARITAAQIAKFRSEFRELDAKHDAEVIKWMPFPKTLPAFSMLVRDSAGNIWARNYDIDPARSRYDVFASTGRWLGSITLPVNTTLLEAGADWVLLRAGAPGEEPLVHLHRLQRRR